MHNEQLINAKLVITLKNEKLKRTKGVIKKCKMNNYKSVKRIIKKVQND